MKRFALTVCALIAVSGCSPQLKDFPYESRLVIVLMPVEDMTGHPKFADEFSRAGDRITAALTQSQRYRVIPGEWAGSSARVSPKTVPAQPKGADALLYVRVTRLDYARPRMIFRPSLCGLRL